MKKRIRIFVCMALILGLLAGCNTAPSATPAATTPPTQTTDSAAPSTAPEETGNGLDMENKPVLRILMPFMNSDPNNDKTGTVIQELTGYTTNYELLPSEDTLSKLNTIIASKEPYDIFILNKSDFENTVAIGAYEDLNELLPTYAPDLQAKTDPGLWINVTIDGNIKGVPEAMAYESYGLSYRVRMDLLEKAGITAMPQTPDELYTALKAVKDELGIIPLAGMKGSSKIPEIASAYGLYNDGSKLFNVVGDQLLYHAETPGAKDYITFMNKLFTEGLLDNEFAQNNGEAVKEKFLSGKAAIYQTAWWNEPTATDTIMEKFPEAKLDYLPPLKGEDGSAGLAMPRGVNRVTVIPKVAVNKEHALNFMNVKVEDEIFREISIGTENVHYTKTGEQTYEPIAPTFFEDKDTAHYFATGSDSAAYSIYWSQTRIKKNPLVHQEWQKEQAMAATVPGYYEPLTFMQPDKTYSELITGVNTFAEDSYVQFITGTRPLTEWDDFIQELNDTGLSEISQIVNEWWSANSGDVTPFLQKVYN